MHLVVHIYVDKDIDTLLVFDSLYHSNNVTRVFLMSYQP